MLYFKIPCNPSHALCAIALAEADYFGNANVDFFSEKTIAGIKIFPPGIRMSEGIGE